MRSSFHPINLVETFVFAMLLMFSVGAQGKTLASLPPVEHCDGDASFTQFRERLKAVVAAKDREAFIAMLAPDVLVDFGGGSGREAFTEQWTFDASEYGNVWDQLGTMLSLGCEQEEGARIIPSLIIQVGAYPEEAVTDVVLILPGAKLYREIGVESPNPRTTPWSVATVISRAADWGTGVRLPDGREGNIPDDRVYEPAGYRMIIEQDNAGKWMITAFIAGD